MRSSSDLSSSSPSSEPSAGDLSPDQKNRFVTDWWQEQPQTQTQYLNPISAHWMVKTPDGANVLRAATPAELAAVKSASSPSGWTLPSMHVLLLQGALAAIDIALIALINKW